MTNSSNREIVEGQSQGVDYEPTAAELAEEKSTYQNYILNETRRLFHLSLQFPQQAVNFAKAMLDLV